MAGTKAIKTAKAAKPAAGRGPAGHGKIQIQDKLPNFSSSAVQSAKEFGGLKVAHPPKLNDSLNVSEIRKAVRNFYLGEKT